MLSIIIVTYNAEQNLKMTLDSLIEQTYIKYELIVKDACSKDKTKEILDEYRKKFIENGIAVNIIIEQDNGIYDGMNQAIEYINKKWVYFLNAGDSLYDKDTLEKIINKLDDKDDIIYGSTNIVLKKDISKIVKPINLQKIIKKMIFCHQSVIIKSKIMKEIKYDTTYKICADYNFFLDVYLKKYIFKKIDVIFSNYDLNGFSNENALKTLKENRDISLKKNNFIYLKIYFYYMLLREKLKLELKKLIGKSGYEVLRKYNLFVKGGL